MEMNVLHIGCAFFPYKGGSSVRLGELISNQKNTKSYIITHIIQDDGELHGAENIFRVKKYFSLTTIKLTYQILAEFKPKAVVLHNPWVILFWIMILDPLHRILRVTEIHNFRDESWYKRLVVGFLYRRMDTTVVLANNAVNLMRKRYRVKRHRIVVVRNGAPKMPKIETLSESNDKVVFCYIGTFHPWQGVFVLAEALHKIPPDFYKNAKIIIAGGGPLEKKLYEKIEPLIHNGYVQWCGWVSKSEADGVLAKSDIVLIPRISTLGTEHIVPLKVFEALNQRKAILATDVGGLTEVLKHNVNAWIVPPGDPGAIAKGMLLLASNAPLRNQIGEKGASQISSYESWEDSGIIYERIFNNSQERSKS